MIERPFHNNSNPTIVAWFGADERFIENVLDINVPSKLARP
jgi:hypothetical protein